MAWTKRQAEIRYAIQTMTTGELIESMIEDRHDPHGSNFFEAKYELTERFKHIDEPRIEQLRHDWEEKEKAERS